MARTLTERDSRRIRRAYDVVRVWDEELTRYILEQAPSLKIRNAEKKLEAAQAALAEVKADILAEVTR